MTEIEPPPRDEPASSVHPVDGGDLGCARLLVLLRDHAAKLPTGTVVHLTTSDPVAPIDLPAWCRMVGHTYLGPVPSPATHPTYAILLIARPTPTHPDKPWHAATTPGKAAPLARPETVEKGPVAPRQQMRSPQINPPRSTCTTEFYKERRAL